MNKNDIKCRIDHSLCSHIYEALAVLSYQGVIDDFEDPDTPKIGQRNVQALVSDKISVNSELNRTFGTSERERY